MIHIDLVHQSPPQKEFPVSHRRLAEFLQLETRTVEMYITGARGSYGFSNSIDFYEQTLLNLTGGRPQLIYWLSFSAAKEICMLAPSDRGKQARLHFIDCERKLKQPKQEFLQLDLRQSLELNLKLLNEKEAAEAALAIAVPKAAAFEVLMDIKQNSTVSQVANCLGKPWGEIKLFRWLREQKILKTGGINHNLPYQKYIEEGWFEVIETVTPVGKKRQTVVTAKGEMKIVGLIGGNQNMVVKK